MQNFHPPSAFSFPLFLLPPLLFGGLLIFALKNYFPFIQRPAWLRLAILNLLALLFFLTSAFLIAETYYRFIYDTTDSLNYTFVSDRWVRRHYHYNAAHIRDNIDYPDAIPAGRRRVTFIGDSFTEAHGVKNVDDRFANLIRQAHPDWDVQVLAVAGMDTGAELQAVERLAQHDYQMDLVVLVYCLNDISDLMTDWNKALSGLYANQDQRPWLVNQSYFADTYYYRLKVRLSPKIPDFFAILPDAYRGPLWQTQTTRLAKFREVVESKGGHLAVVTFPFFNVLGSNYPYQFMHDQLNDFWRAQKVPHLDLLPTYKEIPGSELVVNQLDSHPNEHAHALAATAIDKFLTPELKTFPPKKAVP